MGKESTVDKAQNKETRYIATRRRHDSSTALSQLKTPPTTDHRLHSRRWIFLFLLTISLYPTTPFFKPFPTNLYISETTFESPTYNHLNLTQKKT